MIPWLLLDGRSNRCVRNVFAWCWVGAFALGKVVAQAPVVAPVLPDTVCVGGNLFISNTIATTSYAWDFCVGDGNNDPTATLVTKLLGSDNVLALETIFDGKQWFCFFVAQASNKLYRLHFDNGLDQAPTSTIDLGNPGGFLNNTDAIDFIKEGENWYALAANLGNSNIIRYSFGSELTNVPTANNLSNFGIIDAPRVVKIAKSLNKTVALVTSFSNNHLIVVDFGNSVSNVPSIAYTTPAFPGAQQLWGMEVVQECNEWVGLAVTFASNKIYRLSFGNSLLNVQIIEDITAAVGAIPLPDDVDIIYDQGKYLAYVQSRASGLFKLDFGRSLLNVPTARRSVLNVPGYTDVFKFTLAKDKSKYVGFGVNFFTKDLYRINFLDNCVASTPASNETVPSNVSFSQPGKYYVDLIVRDKEGNRCTFTDSLLVKPSVAPPAFFTADDQCTGTATKFSGPASNDITAWEWDFGDNATGNGQNPTHQYKSGGPYRVVLTTKGVGGCNNRFGKPITIYNNHKPVPKFGSSFACSGALTQFADQSAPYPNEPVQSWQWDFGDGSTSNEQNPSHVFKAVGNYAVTLAVAGISGCDSTISQPITVLPGAAVEFNVGNVCLGNATTFTNATVPEGAWLWNFGEPSSTNNTSVSKDASHTYAVAGLYSVALSVTTVNGCTVTRRKQIRIGVLPVVDFVYSQVCTGSPVDFTVSALNSDTTTAALSWDFGDPISANNASIEEAPSHTFANPGVYTVTLKLTTSLGCQGRISKMIEVKPSSTPNFTFGTACATQPVAFTDASTTVATDLTTNWQWNFGDNSPVVRIRNPVHTYQSPGTYAVTLKINGSQSGCQFVSAKRIEVSPLPQVDFTAVPNCVDYTVHFVNNTTVGRGETIEFHEWNFGGEGSSNELNPSFSFKRPGNYVVTLKIKTIGGCESSTSRSIAVSELPEAAFRFSPDFQSPPLEVQFTNDSRRANDYRWDFGDNSPASAEPSPRHTYDYVGVYPVTLFAAQRAGCVDTLVKMVNVVMPVADVIVRSAIADRAGGLYTVVVELFNSGTVPLTSLNLRLEAGTVFQIQERWVGKLNPNQSLIYPFKAQIINTLAQALPYLCVQALKPNGTDGPTPEDDRFCTSLLEEFAVLPGYPNPAADQLIVPCILPDGEPVVITVYNAQGKHIFSATKENTQPGLKELKINVASFSEGLYLLEIVCQEKAYSQRFIKINEIARVKR